MTIKIAYSETDNISEQVIKGIAGLDKDEENPIQFNVVSYDDTHHKQRKDALQLKASCGARLTPFCAVYNDDKEIIKAFYSEVGECTVFNILEYIKNEIL